MPAATKLKLRRGTAAQWTASNPVLADGEPGWEHNTTRLKIGDGVSTWSDLPYLDGGPGGGSGSAADLTDINVFNVKNFGATGNGVTDDRVSIQAAIDALVAAGGGVLYFPDGIYIVSVVAHPVVGGSNYSGIFIPSNCTVRGAGRNVSIIKLKASTISNNPSLSRTVCIATAAGNINAGANSDITIEDITFDGNSPNQKRDVTDGATTNASTNFSSTAAAFSANDVGRYLSGTGIPVNTYIVSVTSGTQVVMSAAATATGSNVNVTIGSIHYGLFWRKCTRIKHNRVTFQDVRGTAPSPPGETAACDFQAGYDVTWLDCEVKRVGTFTETATGIGAIASTNVKIINTIAYSMTYGMGVAVYECSIVRIINVHAFLNGFNGINIEESDDVVVSDSSGGGQASNVAGNDPYPYSNAVDLGNAQSGIVINGTTNFQVVNSSGSLNGNGGVVIVAGPTGNASSGIVSSGVYNTNLYGVYADPKSEPLVRVRNVICQGNSTANIFPKYLTETNPLDIPGLQSWYDVHRQEVAADAEITQLTDWSGNIRHLPAAAGERAVNKVNILNGRSVARFDGVDNVYKVGSGVFAYGICTLVMVVKWSGASTFPNFNGLFTSTSAAILIGNQSTNEFWQVSALFKSNRVKLVTPKAPMGSWAIISISLTAGWSMGDGTFVGQDRGIASRFWNGDIAEILSFNPELSAPQLEEIEDYLAVKYGAV